jgi:hypothetical protein
MPVEMILRLLRFVADHDIHSQIWWKDDLRFFANVSDVFWWGTSDLEEITPEKIEAFERAVIDCEQVSDIGEVYGGWLFAARNRKLRPQGAAYPQENKLWPLFDAVGPEREVRTGNPYRPGEYKPSKVA